MHRPPPPVVVVVVVVVDDVLKLVIVLLQMSSSNKSHQAFCNNKIWSSCYLLYIIFKVSLIWNLKFILIISSSKLFYECWCKAGQISSPFNNFVEAEIGYVKKIAEQIGVENGEERGLSYVFVVWF